MAEGLRRKSLRGFGWAFGQQAGSQLSRMLFSILLARILSPEDYGLIGLGILCYNFLQILATFGIGDGLIQFRRDADPAELATLFRLHASLALATASLLYLAAPLVAGWYGMEALTPVMRLLALNFVFSIGVVVPKAILEKSLRFEVVARRAVPATLLSGLFALAAAHAGWGIYSLVVLYMAEPAILALSLLPWIPRARPAPLREVLPVLRYSWKLSLAGVLGFIGKNIDAAVIGKWIGPAQLGLYQLGFRLTRVPTQNLAAVLDRVLFPAYSTIQDDKPRMGAAYARVLRAMSLLILPAMTFAALSLETLVPLLLPTRWLPAIPVMQVFCVLAIVQTMGRGMNAVIQALGRSDIVLVWVFFTAPANIAAVALSAGHGIVAVALALVTVRLLIQLGQQHVIARLLDMPYKRLLLAELSGLPLAILLQTGHGMMLRLGWNPWLRLGGLLLLIFLPPAWILARHGRAGAWEWLIGAPRPTLNG